jgi:hypothetical protein
MSSFPVRRKVDRPLPRVDIAKAIRIQASAWFRAASPIEKPG